MYLKSIDPGSNRFRWYGMALQPNLFGGIDVVCSWGRIGQRGREKGYRCENEAIAKAVMKRVARIRARHGYTTSAAERQF